ncbi:MAG: sigma-70 family RNA polymerase sigma factor [Casimicrobium sp.]
MMEFDNETAFALLARIKDGDEKAFTTLYTAMSRRIFAFALNQIHDEARAEEVVIDTMHEVWKKPHQFNGTSKLSTWILGIARYKVLNSFRESRHDHDELNDEIAESVESEAQTPFESLAEQQRSAGVRRCMEKLSNEHRECMHLAFFEGLALAEIAELQSCPENTVKTRLFHARQKIKNCLRLLLASEGIATPETMK